jgi:uncharacterized protein (TIGR03437 family)
VGKNQRAARNRGAYALILEDDPAAKAMRPGGARNAPEVVAKRQAIMEKQASLESQLKASGFEVTGATNTLLNAVFVKARSTDVVALKALSGVRYVAPLHSVHLMLDAAVQLINAPAAWNALGGIPNAGAGQKIAIIDTGVDNTHPAFQGTSLVTPNGFPLCDTMADCAFTNNKVIVARSYVQYTAGIPEVGGDASTDFPDDYSARDRVGHGTAVAMCAGGNTNPGPLSLTGQQDTITGLAPQAYLGNYKVYGSPGINDGASDQAIIMAFEDAFNDGMDVANFSSGALPDSGPYDTGAVCGNPNGVACDPLVATVESAVGGNMVVVVAAGNDGADGTNYPPLSTYNTIDSPGYAPDVIGVGATGNSHQFIQTVNVNGSSVPSYLQSLNTSPSVGPSTNGSLTAPIIDASKVGDQYGCSSYPGGSMNGDVALIERGPLSNPCDFSIKVDNAQTAGAVAVIFYDDQIEQGGGLFTASALGTGIPSFFIDQSDGLSLQSFIDANTGITVTLNSIGFTYPADDTDQVTYFSSRGPGIGNYSIKPDVVAPGENVYMAAQDYDPNGVMYSTNRYIVESGTSFATPMTAGIAALVRQQNPGLDAFQVKSAIVNTATDGTDGTDTTPVTDPNVNGSLTVLSAGAGKVNALAAIGATVTAVPSTVSFGALQSGSQNNTQSFTVTNSGSAPVSLTLSVNRITADSATQLALNTTSINNLAKGASATVDLTLSGTRPAPGIYQGTVNITNGAAVSIQVPYLYMVGDGVPANVYAEAGSGDVGFVDNVNYEGGLFMRVLDQYGVPVAGVGVNWGAPDGGTILEADSTTDQYGQAGAETVLGSVPGYYTFNFSVNNSNQTFSTQDLAYGQPTLVSASAVNAASYTLGNGIAPGSYISLFGTYLSDVSQGASYTPLPIAMETPTYYVSVAFDANGVSVPGALSFVSPGQINVQVPWELAGQSSVLIKVNNEPLNGNLITVPVTTYSPALFVVNGIAAALNLNYQLITTSNPATRGDYVVLYANGLGPVSNQPADGAVAQGNPLSSTTTAATVTIGGQPANVEFAGLAPGFAGLYQLNVQVPTNISAGSQPVVVSIGGADAPTVNLPVQ